MSEKSKGFIKLSLVVSGVAIVAFLLVLFWPKNGLGGRSEVNPRADVFVSAEAESNVCVSVVVPSNTGTSTGVLVDLSDNVNFPHVANTTTASINVSKVSVSNYTQNSTASSTVQIGVIASTTNDGLKDIVDLAVIKEISWEYDRANGIGSGADEKVWDLSPSFFKTRLSNASTTDYLADVTTGSGYGYIYDEGDFGTTTLERSPRGDITVRPQDGDLVFRIINQKGTATTTIETCYQTDE